MQKSNPILIIGGGGHAKVVLDSLLAAGEEVIGFVDSDPEKKQLLGYNRLGGDDILATYESGRIRLANGLGSVGVPAIRFEKYVAFKQRGFAFATVIHPSAIVSTHAVLGEGVQVMAGAVVQAGTSIGENTIINTNASVDHDCHLEDHIHVAPGATLSGGVQVGRACHIGAGATVIQGIHIGDRCVVGAGAVVVNHIAAQSTVVGVPAKPVGSVQHSKVGGK